MKNTLDFVVLFVKISTSCANIEPQCDAEGYINAFSAEKSRIGGN